MCMTKGWVISRWIMDLGKWHAQGKHRTNQSYGLITCTEYTLALLYAVQKGSLPLFAVTGGVGKLSQMAFVSVASAVHFKLPNNCSRQFQ